MFLNLLFATTSVKAEDPLGFNYESDAGLELSRDDPRTVVGRIIEIAFGLLGTVFVVIVLYGGFKYMTAGGNTDDVAKARKIIFSGVIGLVIILMAWAITTFVFDSLEKATDGNSGKKNYPILK